VIKATLPVKFRKVLTGKFSSQLPAPSFQLPAANSVTAYREKGNASLSSVLRERYRSIMARD
jgi:hypothetical protein